VSHGSMRTIVCSRAFQLSNTYSNRIIIKNDDQATSRTHYQIVVVSVCILRLFGRFQLARVGQNHTPCSSGYCSWKLNCSRSDYINNLSRQKDTSVKITDSSVKNRFIKAKVVLSWKSLLLWIMILLLKESLFLLFVKIHVILSQILVWKPMIFLKTAIILWKRLIFLQTLQITYGKSVLFR
jgi:hypothetical protein